MRPCEGRCNEREKEREKEREREHTKHHLPLETRNVCFIMRSSVKELKIFLHFSLVNYNFLNGSDPPVYSWMSPLFWCTWCWQAAIVLRPMIRFLMKYLHISVWYLFPLSVSASSLAPGSICNSSSVSVSIYKISFFISKFYLVTMESQYTWYLM